MLPFHHPHTRRQLDKLRQTYSLKEQALVEVLAEAVGIDKDSAARHKLKEWRDTGSGRFKETAAQARSAPLRPPTAEHDLLTCPILIPVPPCAQVLGPYVRQESADDPDSAGATIEEARAVLVVSSPDTRW